jgi:Tfp pilus assembly protein PilF/NAD-dependent SIR2 family protein deacetylase
MIGKVKNRSVDRLAESIFHAKGQCVFLVGAGFSLSAGIPLAGRLVEEIKATFPCAYDEAKIKVYNHVMGELTPHQRSILLTDYIDQAKVNWAHLALAQLFQANKIDRILTVNFDPLILKACSMVGEFPAVYDLATASEFKESRISPKSVFYLNGQHTGFAMLNAEEELDKHKDRLNDIVRNTGTKRIWVVVGYSGDADPLADVLKDIAQSSGFDNGLYWIGNSEKPSANQEKILSSDNTFFIGKQDADEFMEALAQKLDCFPPVLLTDPLSHIETIISENIDFSTGGPYAEYLRKRLSDMIQTAEGASSNVPEKAAHIPDLSQLLLAGKYSDIFMSWSVCGEQFTEEQRDDVAWAYTLSGNDVEEEAGEIAIGDLTAARIKWYEAGEKYAQALSIKPDMHEALNNWGIALNKEAQALLSEDRGKAFEKWAEAGEKYAQALSIKPDMHEALNNWGIALNKEAQALLSEDRGKAFEKWAEAGEKYAQALSIKPDMHDALNNWGVGLNKEAQALLSEDRGEAFEKWAEAGEKYAQALSIKPDMHDALNNWGNALDDEAQALLSEDRGKAFEKWAEAGEKYAQALSIKPDNHDALNNWGIALLLKYDVIKGLESEKAFELLDKAGEILKKGVEINPRECAYNYACYWALIGDQSQSIKWLKVANFHNQLPSKAHIDQDSDFDLIRETAEFNEWYQRVFDRGEH